MRGLRLAAALLPFLALAACTGLFFQPMQQHLHDPATMGFTYRDVEFAAADGTRLHGWYFPPQGEDWPADREPLGSVLFLHGNAENISTHFANVAWLARHGFAVFAFDYRGYGRSESSPDLDGLHLDIAAALDTLSRMPETDPGRVAVFGQSLGGALALTAIADNPEKDRLRALIVEGAFSSYREITREKLDGFWLTWALQGPLGLTVDDRYRPIEAAARIAPVPLLIIADGADTIVPPHHAEALYAAAGEPKAIWRLPEAGHTQALATLANRQRLVEYLKNVMDKPIKRNEQTFLARHAHRTS